jgi:hypothetical protein
MGYMGVGRELVSGTCPICRTLFTFWFSTMRGAMLVIRCPRCDSALEIEEVKGDAQLKPSQVGINHLDTPMKCPNSSCDSSWERWRDTNNRLAKVNGAKHIKGNVFERKNVTCERP